MENIDSISIEPPDMDCPSPPVKFKQFFTLKKWLKQVSREQSFKNTSFINSTIWMVKMKNTLKRA